MNSNYKGKTNKDDDIIWKKKRKKNNWIIDHLIICGLHLLICFAVFILDDDTTLDAIIESWFMQTNEKLEIIISEFVKQNEFLKIPSVKSHATWINNSCQKG